LLLEIYRFLAKLSSRACAVAAPQIHARGLY
jgi:hypothetical protein